VPSPPRGPSSWGGGRSSRSPLIPLSLECLALARHSGMMGGFACPDAPLTPTPCCHCCAGGLNDWNPRTWLFAGRIGSGLGYSWVPGTACPCSRMSAQLGLSWLCAGARGLLDSETPTENLPWTVIRWAERGCCCVCESGAVPCSKPGQTTGVGLNQLYCLWAQLWGRKGWFRAVPAAQRISRAWSCRF
jgi:hypothetical protein